jgi:hypothetical protein
MFQGLWQNTIVSWSHQELQMPIQVYGPVDVSGIGINIPIKTTYSIGEGTLQSARLRHSSGNLNVGDTLSAHARSQTKAARDWG